MTQADYPAFVVEFNRLLALEKFRGKADVIAQRADVYFHVLKGLALEDVRAKADAWLRVETTFPMPAEWRHQVTRQTVDYRVLTGDEQREYLRAERLGFEDPEPCGCVECVRAGLHDRAEHALRYVPLEDRFTGRPEQARLVLGGAIVTPGEWLHGQRLVRWYTARASFWGTAYAKYDIGASQQRAMAKVPFAQRMERIFAKAGTMTKTKTKDDPPRVDRVPVLAAGGPTASPDRGCQR